MITFFNDLDMSDRSPRSLAAQLAGTRGEHPTYDAGP
jgi:hypothetical protein